MSVIARVLYRRIYFQQFCCFVFVFVFKFAGRPIPVHNINVVFLTSSCVRTAGVYTVFLLGIRKNVSVYNFVTFAFFFKMEFNVDTDPVYIILIQLERFET